MTPEEIRLEDAKWRLIDAALRYADDRLNFNDIGISQREMFSAAMDYAETVHWVEWSRAKQAEERDKRLSEAATDKREPS